MKIQQTPGKSFSVGTITDGCKLCIKGRKLVLFVTGLCSQKCWYCTISKKRWQKDIICANEKTVKKDSDIIDEAVKSGALGAGITGGEPMMKVDRVARYIRLLKKRFGKKFHIHMYTCGLGYDPKLLKKLYDAGLDEIRIHKNKELVRDALLYKWRVGMEVPVLPGKERELCQLIDYLENIGASFLNLNELEFSERNIEPMEKLGYTLTTDSLTAVKGSRETAMKVLEYAKNKRLIVHFCTAALKMNYQLRNRLVNRATNIKKPFEKVTRDGFLLKGIVFGIKNKYSIENIGIKNYFINKERNRIEMSIPDAKRAAKKGIRAAIVEEYPSSNPWDFELTPLN